MTHDEALERASLGFERGLTPAEQESLELHLRDCAECRTQVEWMRAAHGALMIWGAESAPLPLAQAGSTQHPSATAKNAWRARAWPWLAAASLVGVLAAGGLGFAVGRGTAPRDSRVASTAVGSDAGAVFTLLLEEPGATWPPPDVGMRPGYVAWRDSLIAVGAFAGGARFMPDAGWYVASSGDALPANSLPRNARPAPNYSGYFLVRARDYSEAVAIARSSPHLAFGGILVRGPSPP